MNKYDWQQSDLRHMQPRGKHSRVCVCDGSIVLLGDNCSREHFLDRSMDHYLVDLDLALRMQRNPRLIDHFSQELEEIIKILRLLREHSKKLILIKAKHDQDKHNLLSSIHELLNQTPIELESITHDTSEKIWILNNYKTTLCDEGRALVEKFRRSGISSILNILRIIPNVFEYVIPNNKTMYEMRYDRAGYSSEYILLNSGKFIFILLSILICCAIFRLISKMLNTNHKLQQYLNRIIYALKLNLLMHIAQMHLEVTISSLINVVNFSYRNGYAFINLAVSLIISLLCFYPPIKCFIYIIRHHDEIKRDTLKSEF